MNGVELSGGRRSVMAMIAATALAGLPGCIIVADTSGGGSWRRDTVTETRTVTVPHVAGSSIDVRTQNGAVEVQQGEGEQVVVTATISARTAERLAKTTVCVDRAAGGTLQIRVQWPDGVRASGEGASFVVRTPNAKGQTVESGVPAPKAGPESK